MLFVEGENIVRCQKELKIKAYNPKANKYTLHVTSFIMFYCQYLIYHWKWSKMQRLCNLDLELLFKPALQTFQTIPFFLVILLCFFERLRSKLHKCFVFVSLLDLFLAKLACFKQFLQVQIACIIGARKCSFSTGNFNKISIFKNQNQKQETSKILFVNKFSSLLGQNQFFGFKSFFLKFYGQFLNQLQMKH